MSKEDADGAAPELFNSSEHEIDLSEFGCEGDSPAPELPPPFTDDGGVWGATVGGVSAVETAVAVAGEEDLGVVGLGTESTAPLAIVGGCFTNRDVGWCIYNTVTVAS